MRKITKIMAALAASAVMVIPCSTIASATTVSDVIAAAYAAGWPDWMVQEAVNMYSGGNYTSEQCDKAISMIYQYDESAGQQIADQFGVTPPASSITTAPPEADKSQTTTTTTTTARPSDKTFIDASLDDKKNYLNSMTDKEKQDFINTMTDAERNSVLKQLSASDKASLISNFMQVGEEFGISFSIDEISEDNFIISASDENGKLLNVSSMSVTVDSTGKSYTAPVLIGSGMIFFALTGTVFTLKRKTKKD